VVAEQVNRVGNRDRLAGQRLEMGRHARQQRKTGNIDIRVEPELVERIATPGATGSAWR